MANRIIGNIIIIDSAMGNAPVLGADSAMTKFMVNAFAVWQVSTAGAIILTGANTATDIIFKSDWVALSADTAGKIYANNPSWYSFGQAQPIEILKAPTVTSGTAFLYFV